MFNRSVKSGGKTKILETTQKPDIMKRSVFSGEVISRGCGASPDTESPSKNVPTQAVSNTEMTIEELYRYFERIRRHGKRALHAENAAQR